MHRFYQEQYQIDGGKQDRYTTGSDAIGLTQGTYATKSLPIYRYLHGSDAPKYVLADHFFQAAFGGSFLNHQFLIAARAPLDTDPSATYTPAGPPREELGARRQRDADQLPAVHRHRTRWSTTGLTQKCADPSANKASKACGDFAVNTIQPGTAPHGSGQYLPLIDDAKYPNIGDRLSAKGVSWNWYSGGWDDAESGHPGAAVPVPPPAVQLLRRLRARHTGPHAPEGRAEVHRLGEGRQPADRLVRQALRR